MKHINDFIIEKLILNKTIKRNKVTDNDVLNYLNSDFMKKHGLDFGNNDFFIIDKDYDKHWKNFVRINDFIGKYFSTNSMTKTVAKEAVKRIKSDILSVFLVKEYFIGNKFGTDDYIICMIYDYSKDENFLNSKYNKSNEKF